MPSSIARPDLPPLPFRRLIRFRIFLGPILNLTSSSCPCLPPLADDLSVVLVERLLVFAAAAINLALDDEAPDPEAEFAEASGRSDSCARIVLGYGEIRAASAILCGDIAERNEFSVRENAVLVEHAWATILRRCLSALPLFGLSLTHLPAQCRIPVSCGCDVEAWRIEWISRSPLITWLSSFYLLSPSLGH